MTDTHSDGVNAPADDGDGDEPASSSCDDQNGGTSGGSNERVENASSESNERVENASSESGGDTERAAAALDAIETIGVDTLADAAVEAWEEHPGLGSDAGATGEAGARGADATGETDGSDASATDANAANDTEATDVAGERSDANGATDTDEEADGEADDERAG